MDTQEERNDLLVLFDEDGHEVEFTFLDVIEYEGEEYLLLLPTDSDSNEVNIFLIQPLNEEEENYVPVESEETLLAVYAMFKEKYKDTLTFTE